MLKIDRLIETYEYVEDGDLRICYEQGVAYQHPIEILVPYEKDYFSKYEKYEDTKLSRRLNQGRIDIVSKWSGETAMVLDIGIGSGEYIKKRNIYRDITFGTDVNHYACEWLKKRNLYNNDLDKFKNFTMWDVLEHCNEPERYLKRMRKGSHLYVSIPIFPNLDNIRSSKHYRPNEHLYYFTKPGFIRYMANYGFTCLDYQDFEIKSGREDIYTFAFHKTIPDYDDLVDEYRKIHSERYYGHSSEALLPKIQPIIKSMNPSSILDYGCGRSSLVNYFWNDGQRQIYKYDPAIEDYMSLPAKVVDLVICTDVLEHILLRDMDRIFQDFIKLTNTVILGINISPARKKLSNGMNAHVTIMPKSWWIGFIKRYYKQVEILDFDEYDLLVRAIKK